MPVFVVFEWYQDELRKNLQRRIVGVFVNENSADSKVMEIVNQRYIHDREELENEIEEIERRGKRDPKTRKVSHVVPAWMTQRLERELSTIDRYTTWLRNISELPYYEKRKLEK